MFMVEIAGLKILFTGDYSREDDRHLVSAEVPPVKPDVLICESTYGTASHMPRLEKEARLMKVTTDILNRGGRVLMPVFALGRAQELLLILDEYWEKHPNYQQYPIYYASNLARKCMDVYRTYINTMNDKIKRAMFEGEGRNPWDFRWIRSLKNIDRFEDVGGCVMLASPGMLQVCPHLDSFALSIRYYWTGSSAVGHNVEEKVDNGGRCCCTTPYHVCIANISQLSLTASPPAITSPRHEHFISPCGMSPKTINANSVIRRTAYPASS